MAPVGDFETLAAAIQAGANSVYFGIEQLNMRARSAKNFTIDDLNQVVKICHQNNIKAYLALNTIIYDHDLNMMRKIVDAAKEANIDAIIASDVSVMMYARSKDIPVHASTQLNISNIEALKFYAQFCDVMVLARELTLTQVKKLAEQIEQQQIKGPSCNLVRLEIFIHGALCMAISGRCYLSLHIFNSSANRGACKQPCRRSYIVIDKEEGYELEVDNEYIMSPKDLATIDFLDKVLDTGVSILKIEGRARPPEYVKTTTQVYREAVTAVKNGTFTQERVKEWRERLSKVFNRGFWDGYYLGRKLGEWADTYGSKATRQKFYIGKITNYFSKIKVAEIQILADEISINDEFLVIGNKTGVVEGKVLEIRKDDKPIKTAKKGDIISIPITEKVRRNDKFYKLITLR